MNGRIRTLFAVSLATAAIAPLCARATVVTFESPPAPTFNTPGQYYVRAPITEAGMTYDALVADTVYLNHFGNPGQDLEGDVFTNGGVAVFTSATNALFTYSGLDFDAYSDHGAAAGSLTITVSGYRNGVLVGADSYTQATDLGDGFKTLDADHLSGLQLDRMTISLPCVDSTGTVSTVDNVRFDEPIQGGPPPPPPPPGVPEPSAWALLICGLGGVGGALRRRRGAAARNSMA